MSITQAGGVFSPFSRDFIQKKKTITIIVAHAYRFIRVPRSLAWVPGFACIYSV